MEKTEELNFLSALWPFIGIIFLIVLGVLLLNQQFNKKLYAQKLEKEKLKAQHQFELLQSSIAVQEEERKRIARDLHDELGAALSMTRMHLMQIEQQNAKQDTELATRLQSVRSMTEKALASMRRISHELMPPQLESFGLLQTLETIATDLNRLDQLHIEIVAPGNFNRLPMPIELGLYRVCMELINNTIRHAQADYISIRLQQQHGRLLLDYRDNGKGLPESFTKKGIGQRSIETRMHSLGASFEMKNHKDGGMHMSVEIKTEASYI
ncbi:MAG: sensor histidine kinase [Bacteroidia bacterium]